MQASALSNIEVPVLVDMACDWLLKQEWQLYRTAMFYEELWAGGCCRKILIIKHSKAPSLASYSANLLQIMQAHATLVRQPIVCLMGQCELIVTKIWSMQWAHVCAWTGELWANAT